MSALLDRYFERHKPAVEKALERFLPSASTAPRVLHRAMRYSVDAGGKRLRPILVIAGAEISGGSARDVLPIACALEFIHTYSLVHDDLPAMDNDDLRRGKPTNHKVFGEDMAILAGDALLTQAFLLIGRTARRGKLRPGRLAAIVDVVATHAGSLGMVGGQAADIQADKSRWKKKGEFPTPAKQLDFIHKNKTAALIRASLLAGAHAVGTDLKSIRALDRYGKYIGLAFQIADDILDEVGDKRKLGKRGSDRENEKLTYSRLYGLTESRRRAQGLVAAAHRSLQSFGKKAAVLHALADYIVERDH